MADRATQPVTRVEESPVPQGYGALEESSPESESSTTEAEGRAEEDQASNGHASNGDAGANGDSGERGLSEGSSGDGGAMQRLERLGRAVGQRGGAIARASRRLSLPDLPSAKRDPKSPSTNGAERATDSGGELDGAGVDEPSNGSAESDLESSAVVAGATSPVRAATRTTPNVAPVPHELAARPTTDAPPVPQRRPTPDRRGRPRTPPPVAAPTTSRSRPQSRSEEEMLRAAGLIQPSPRWGRQRVRVVRGTSSRRMVRRVDTWTVFKLSLFFYLLGLLVLLVAGVILWNVASTFGTITSIQKTIRTLFVLNNFRLRSRPLLEYTAAGGLVLVILGTIVNTVAALIYNLISDIFGGIQVVVVTEPE